MAKSATPADLQIKPRDLHIDREAPTPRWWLNGDPFGTAVLTGLGLSPTARAEELTVAEFVRLASALDK